MIKEVDYKGFSASPSDYECQDGELAGVVDLIHEDGSLKPILPPVPELVLPEDAYIVYFHETNDFKHYILRNNNGTFGFILAGESKIYSIPGFNYTDFYRVSSIGNTLLILTDTGMHYLLWKAAQSKYNYLGTHLPELPISFGLDATVERSDRFWVDIKQHTLKGNDLADYGDGWNDAGTMTDTDSITNTVLAQVNKFIAERSIKKGKFMYPFFVRYAYRLYDGSLTMASAPILMRCADACSPVVSIPWAHRDKGITDWYSRVIAPVFDIKYKLVDEQKLVELKKWSDIVKSVDIFISKPIYTYDQNGKCKRNIRWVNANFNFVSEYKGDGVYKKRDIDSTYREAFKNDLDLVDAVTTWPICVEVPKVSSDKLNDVIKNTSSFYLLSSIPIEKISLLNQKIEVKEDYLQSLTNRETLNDDFDSHDMYYPSVAYMYNQRLNIAGLKKTQFGGFTPKAMCCRGDNGSQSDTVVYIFLKHEGKDIVLKSDASSLGIDDELVYLYYPNVNAYKMIVSGSGKNTEYTLSPHGLLNGAFYFDQFTLPSIQVQTPALSEKTKVLVANKIKTSEVNNPFLFPVKGSNTIGSGSIVSICSAAKALSQGQFGQFPLYAFTTEGVWALEVSQTGSYSARQPITRDICNNLDSVTQLDSAVLFCTERGIMLLSGSDSSCISDSIDDSMTAFQPKKLNGYQKINQLAGIKDEQVDYIPFKQFLKDCGIMYDYTHQRIIVYNKLCAYAYVFSLKDKVWGMMSSSILNRINSYPDAIAMDKKHQLLNFSKEDKEQFKKPINGLLYTRPFKLDARDILKTIDTIIQRGYFKNGHVKQVLYGSNNLFDWLPVWSSSDSYMRGFRGSPYKYFILVVIAKLECNESLSGFSVDYKVRQNNQLR